MLITNLFSQMLEEQESVSEILCVNRYTTLEIFKIILDFSSDFCSNRGSVGYYRTSYATTKNPYARLSLKHKKHIIVKCMNIAIISTSLMF